MGNATVPVAPVGVPPTGAGQTDGSPNGESVPRAENGGRDATRSPTHGIVPVKTMDFSAAQNLTFA